MPAPTVTPSLDKSSYNAGETVTLTVAVQDVPRTVTTPRTATLTGVDDEGNEVTAQVTTQVKSQVPDKFRLTSVKWDDTGVAWSLSQTNPLQATSVA